MRFKKPNDVGELRYVMSCGKVRCLVGLRRYDSDELDWFEVSAHPYEHVEDHAFSSKPFDQVDAELEQGSRDSQ